MERIESPDTSDQNSKREIIAKRLTDPRVTMADIEANIAGEFTYVIGDAFRALTSPVSGAVTKLTICVLTLKNGFTVIGESACASPANFDAELGRKIARGNAVNKVWPVMGYALKQQLSKEPS